MIVPGSRLTRNSKVALSMTFFVCAFKLADFLADYYALYKAVFVYLGLDTDIFLTDYQQTLNLTIFTTGTS